jgi:hypothetical protein
MTKSKSSAPPTKRQLVLHKLEALAESTTHAPEAASAKAKIEELKVRTVQVQVSPVSKANPQGVTEFGHFIVENGDTVVMTDAKGVPLRHRDIQCRVVLLGDQSAEQVARRLTREMYAAGNPNGDFYRRISYPNRSPV